MLRTLLLLGHLLAIALGAGNVPLPVQHLDYAGKVVPHPGLRTGSYGAFVAGRSYAPIDGRAAILESQAVRAGQYIANPSLSAARIQTAAVSRVSPAAVYGHAGGFYSPVSPAFHGLFGPRADSYYGRYHLGGHPYDAGYVKRPVLPPPPVTDPRGRQPVVPSPVGQAPIGAQQVIKRPPPPDASFYDGRGPNPYSHIYGGSYLHRSNYARAPFSAIGGQFVHPEDPFGLYGTQGLAEAAKRREESRRRAASVQDGRLIYGQGRAPLIAPYGRPAASPYSPAHLPVSYYGHSYNPFSNYGPGAYDARYRGLYGGIGAFDRRPSPALGPRPIGDFRYGPGGAVRPRPIDYASPLNRNIPAVGALPYGAVPGQYQTYFDRTRHLSAYRPASLVGPYAYGGPQAYGIPRPNGYVLPPPAAKPLGPDPVKRPISPVVPPPAVVAERRPPPRPVVPPVPQGPVEAPQKVGPVAASPGLAALVSRPAFYQPRRLDDLAGRRQQEILYRGEGYPHPRRLADYAAGVHPLGYAGIANPAVARGAAISRYAGGISHYGLPVGGVIARHAPYGTGLPLVSPYSYEHAKVVEPVVHNNPVFPDPEAVQKSIHTQQVLKA